MFSKKNVHTHLALFRRAGSAFLAASLILIGIGCDDDAGARMNKVEARLQAIESDLREIKANSSRSAKQENDFAGRLTNVEAEMSAEQARAFGLQGPLRALQGETSTLKSQLENVNGRVARTEQDQEAAKTQIKDVDTAQADLRAQAQSALTDARDVQKEVENQKGLFQKMASDVARIKGDLGLATERGAATEHELQELVARGQRVYVRFTISKSKYAQQIGGVTFQLIKADIKRQQFSLLIYADDKTVRKDSRSALEPVQFFLFSKSAQPFELIVQTVTRDQVTGYISEPKDQGLERARPSGNP